MATTYVRFPSPISISGSISTSDAADGPASPGASSAYSILIGAQYNSTLPTFTTGQQGALQADSRGRLLTVVGSAPVVQFMDTLPVLDVASTNIPGSGGTALTIVATLSQAVTKIRVADTTGQWIGLYEGATLRFVINPGMDATVDCSLAAASAIKVKGIFAATINAGQLCVQFI